MIYIKKLPKRKKREYISEKRELRQKYYNSKRWRNMRYSYILDHCLCELCLMKDIVKPAEQIHHLVSPFGEGADTDYLFYNFNNLIALCTEHHSKLHGEKKEESLHHIFYEREDADRYIWEKP